MVFLHLKRLFRLSLIVPNSCLEGITYFVKNNISPGEVPCIVWSGVWPEGVVFLYGLENGQKGLIFLSGLENGQKGLIFLYGLDNGQKGLMFLYGLENGQKGFIFLFGLENGREGLVVLFNLENSGKVL